MQGRSLIACSATYSAKHNIFQFLHNKRLSFLFETEDERKEEQEQAKQLIHSMILKSQEVKFENSHSAAQAALTEPELLKKRSIIIKRLLDKKIMEFAFSVHTLKMSIYESKSKNAKEESLLVSKPLHERREYLCILFQ